MLFYLPTATLVIVFLKVGLSKAVSTSDDQQVFDLAKTMQYQATILQGIFQYPPLHQDLSSEDDDLSDRGKNLRHLVQDTNGLSDTCRAETESILDKIDPAAYEQALSYFPQYSWEMDAFLERNCDVNYMRESIDCDMKHDFSSDSRFLASECELHGGQVVEFDMYARCKDSFDGVSIDMEWDMENAMDCFWPECTDDELNAELENMMADDGLLDLEDTGNCELQISWKNEDGKIFNIGESDSSVNLDGKMENTGEDDDSSVNSPSEILGLTILAISGGLTMLYSAFE